MIRSNFATTAFLCFLGAAAGHAAVNTVTAGSGLAGGGSTSTVTLSVASKGVTNAMLAADAVTSDKIADMTRKISVPAAALNVNPSSSVIHTNGTGLRWDNSFGDEARVVLSKPTDFTSQSSVKFTIYFQTDKVAGTPGDVGFFIRPLSFNAGEEEIDPVDIAPALVHVSGDGFTFGKLYKQDFTIPASNFNKEIWLIKIQRNSEQDTYGHAVTVWGVAVSYRATR